MRRQSVFRVQRIPHETVRMEYSTFRASLAPVQFTEFADRFEAAWRDSRERQTTPPSLALFVKGCEPMRSGLLALLPIDMEYRSKSTSGASSALLEEEGRSLIALLTLKDYVEQFQELRPLGQLPFDLIAWECLLRFDSNRRPQLEEYLSDFPSHAERLHGLFREFGRGEEERVRGKIDTLVSDPWRTVNPQSLETVNPQSIGHETFAQRSATGDRYVAFKPHAEGGLGLVSIAIDSELRREVAVKEIKQQFADLSESRARFIFEAEITGRLEHPGIVPVYDLKRDAGGRPFYVMRFITGSSLDESIRQMMAITDHVTRDRRLRDYVTRMVSVCNTIEYAHQRGVLHRDLKPANILLGAYGETLVVDWGLAKQIGTGDWKGSAESKASEKASKSLEENAASGSRIELAIQSSSATPTFAGRVMGTPFYMPPEQSTGDIAGIGPWSDIYSLGATLFHVICGKPPFAELKGQTLKEILTHVSNGNFRPPRQVNSSAPRVLEAIVLLAMRRVPSERYTSAKALATDLENWLADDAVTAMPESLTRRFGRWLRRHRTVALAVVTSMLLIASVSTVAFFITNSALNRTERLLQIAQLEQGFDQRMAAEETRHANTTAESEYRPLADEWIQASLGDIRGLDNLLPTGNVAHSTDSRRERLLNFWVDTIRQFTYFELSDRNQEILEAEIQRLQDQYPWSGPSLAAQVEGLKGLAKDRLENWIKLEDVKFPDPDFVAEANGWRRNFAPAGRWAVPLTGSPIGNQRMSARFGPEWRSVSVLGLTLGEREGSGYRFLLADESYDPRYPDRFSPTLGDANEIGRLCMLITRGDDVLRRDTVRLLGDPQMTATRQQSLELGMTVNDGRSTKLVTFVDLFPLAQENTRVGIVCPISLTIDEFKLERQRDPSATTGRDSPMQVGDRALSRSELAVARSAYEQVGDDIEARYKLTLTYEQESSDRYAEILREILTQTSLNETANERTRRWYLYAGVALLAQPDDARMTQGEIMDRLRGHFQLAEVVKLIPVAMRPRIDDMMLISGQKFRLVFRGYGDEVSDVAKLGKALELFVDNPKIQRMAYWRLADAYQLDDTIALEEGHQQAEQILRELLGDSPADARNPAGFAQRIHLAQPQPSDHLERVALLRELVWICLYEKRYSDAHLVIDRWLKGAAEVLPSGLWPLLVERARVRVAEGAFKEAEADLREFVAEGAFKEAEADLREFLRLVNPKEPPNDIRYVHFGEASVLLGMLLEKANDSQGALDVWKNGRRREWKNGFPDPEKVANNRGVEMSLEAIDVEGFLSARTDGYMDEEWRNVVARSVSGLGLEGRAVRNILFSNERIKPEWLKVIAENTLRGSRWTQVADDCLLRRMPPRAWAIKVAEAVLYQAVLRIAYEGENTLLEFPDVDQVLAEQATKLVEHFQAGRIRQSDFEFIILAFTGQWNEGEFQRFEKRLGDPDISSGLALVAAHMLAKASKPDDAEKILQRFIFPRADQLPAVYSAMGQRLLKHAEHPP